MVTRENRQMRGILVTSANAGMTVLFGPAHIEGALLFRKRLVLPSGISLPLTDRACSLKQQPNKGKDS